MPSVCVRPHAEALWWVTVIGRQVRVVAAGLASEGIPEGAVGGALVCEGDAEILAELWRGAIKQAMQEALTRAKERGISSYEFTQN